MDIPALQQLLAEHFDIHPTKIGVLEGYESVNYKVSCNDGSRYVLKVHQNDFEQIGILEAENEILALMGQHMPSFFAKAVPNSNGETITTQNVPHPTRLLTYLEGQFLSEIDITYQHLQELGKYLGIMDRILAHYYHPAIAARVLKWDLQHCLSRKPYAQYIKDTHRKSQVIYFFKQYEEKVLPVFYQLRKSTIHGDANDWNVLEQDGHISGFIDFGDMAFTPTINELAIAIPYSIFHQKQPLQAAALIVGAYHQEYPLEPIELEVLYDLIGARLAVSLSHAAYFNRLRPEEEYITISEAPVWNLLEYWLSLNPIHAEHAFKAACGIPIQEKPPVPELLAKRQQHMSRSMSVSYNKPIHMESAAFQYMYAADGTTFLDAYNNIPIVGHSHPKVVEAGQRQMAKLNTNTRYLYPSLHEYSEQLLAKFPKELNKVFFVNSGSAASDLAIRLAKAYSQNSNIAVMQHGYHGNTEVGIDISSYKFEGKGGEGVSSNVITLPMPNVFRDHSLGDEEAMGLKYGEEAIRILESSNGRIASFIAEPILGCGGQVPLPKGYLKQLYAFIRQQGGLCIADEVQIGFGRVGTHFWGFEQHDVVPDIVVLGKPMGNGHPMGAVVCTNEVALAFENGMEFFSSFGGNPVSCEIGKSVLDVIEEEGLQQKSLEIGNYIMQQLRGFQQAYPIIGDVRGSGLFWGMEFVHENDWSPNTIAAQSLKTFLRNNHILIGTDGPYDNVLKSKPPLCFNRKNADRLLEEIQNWLQQYEA